MTDMELLLERLERLAIVLDELMPQCAELVRDAISMLKEQEVEIEQLNGFVNGFSRDAVPVVRCKDCRYCGSEIRDGIKFAKCELKHNWMPQADWFCADGERKDS